MTRPQPVGRRRRALIPILQTPDDRGPRERVERVICLVLVAVLTAAVYWPTLHNGFLPLGFDDGLILQTPALRQLTLANLGTIATQFNHAHYVPVTMLSFALDYHSWGLDPLGYHFTNVVFHAATAVLVCASLFPILPSARSAMLAGLIFALHPVQLEAVSVAVQRKTVLSGALLFLALIFYQRWTTRRQWRFYVACLFVFGASALAKPAAVTFPLLLLLYDYVFVGGRWRLAEKLPFFLVSGAVTIAAIDAHGAVGAIHSFHSGNAVAHTLMISRVALEYVDAILMPLNLSPIYYYSPTVIYSPLNFLALAAILSVCGYVTWRHHRYPWSFFCLWWFLIALLPESNIVPLAQLRADRFLYLPVFGAALWIAIGMERMQRREPLSTRRKRWQVAGGVAVAILAMKTYTSAGIWRDNVSAWSRVVERHPWSATAQAMLGRAYYGEGLYADAERAFHESLRRSADVPDAHLYLAKMYADQGLSAPAEAEVRRFLTLTPGDPEGLQLLAALRQPHTF